MENPVGHWLGGSCRNRGPLNHNSSRTGAFAVKPRVILSAGLAFELTYPQSDIVLCCALRFVASDCEETKKTFCNLREGCAIR